MLGTAQAGVRYAGRTDLMLVDIAPGSTLAGVFTRSATRSAAVLDCQDKLAKLSDKPRHGFAILVNSGNANTFTGQSGRSRCRRDRRGHGAGRGRSGRACLHLVDRRHRGAAERQPRSPTRCPAWWRA
jgi:N-acetylglutamate synthase/N-acetylornithine aminotransferase